MKTTGSIIEYDKIAELGRIKDDNSTPAIRSLFRKSDCDSPLQTQLQKKSIPPGTLAVSYELTADGVDFMATEVSLATSVRNIA
jgi:hypothetical protein